MELLWAACIPRMESDELQFARLGDERVSNASLEGLRAKTQSFSVAFCGMVKAGWVRSHYARGGTLRNLQKVSFSERSDESNDPSFRWCAFSTIINKFLKVTTELPSTAWRCRLRHVPGLSEATLMFDPKPFRMGLEDLQAHKFGSKMQDYDDPFDETPDTDLPNSLMTANNDYTGIYYNCQQTRKNLFELKTQTSNFYPMQRAEIRWQSL